MDMERDGVGAGSGSRWLRNAIAFLAHGFLAAAAWSAGTPAGTLIGNSAILTFSLPNRPAETATATASVVTVAKVISVTVSWQDAAPVTVRSPDTSRPLAFAITNTGNGAETFRLGRDDAQAGDQFDPQSAAAGAIWLESGAQPGFQGSGPNADVMYVPGVNDPALPADGSRIAYLVSDFPAAIPTGATGRSMLVVTSATPGAAAAVPGASLGFVGSVESVAGPATVARATGSYLAAGVSLGLAKTVSAVRDPQGGARVMSGAVLTYRIVLSVTGTGTAGAVALSDPLPATLSYVPGSLAVDGAARTDAADGDGASVSANTVTADFGDLAAPAQRVIQFQATVN